MMQERMSLPKINRVSLISSIVRSKSNELARIKARERRLARRASVHPRHVAPRGRLASVEVVRSGSNECASMQVYKRVYTCRVNANDASGMRLMLLNPALMGPVEHGQPGLHDAKNLLDFYRGNICHANHRDASGVSVASFTQAVILRPLRATRATVIPVPRLGIASRVWYATGDSG
jgi:voltage-gated potassium channel Kch